MTVYPRLLALPDLGFTTLPNRLLMGSMARPFLADPLFVRKAEHGHHDEINTCIGCNQACVDHTFAGKITFCLVNPRARRPQPATTISRCAATLRYCATKAKSAKPWP